MRIGSVLYANIFLLLFLSCKQKQENNIKIVTDSNQHAPNIIENNASKALNGTKEVDLEGF